MGKLAVSVTAYISAIILFSCVSDVISHLPVLCEESKVPYVFVPARSDLGAAIGSNTYVCETRVCPIYYFTSLLPVFGGVI